MDKFSFMLGYMVKLSSASSPTAAGVPVKDKSLNVKTDMGSKDAAPATSTISPPQIHPIPNSADYLAYLSTADKAVPPGQPKQASVSDWVGRTMGVFKGVSGTAGKLVANAPAEIQKTLKKSISSFRKPSKATTPFTSKGAPGGLSEAPTMPPNQASSAETVSDVAKATDKQVRETRDMHADILNRSGTTPGQKA
jgi:hypothetical protein